MKPRRLTILLTAVFALQASGLTSALHCALEHEWGRPPASSPALAADADSDVHPHGDHDGSHCALCQALATAKPLLPTPPAPLAALQPLEILPLPAGLFRPAKISLRLAASRAPPAAALSPLAA